LGFYNFSYLWTPTKDDNINFLDFQAILGAVKGEELDQRNPMIYAIGLAIYPVLFIVLAIFGFCMNWCLFCRCCCRGVPERRSCCEGCCGGHYPTYDGVAELNSRKCVWCCCNCVGYTYHHKDPKTGNQHNSPEDMYQYSFMQKCITRVVVIFFTILMIFWVLWGQYLGNLAMNPALKVMSRAPEGLVDMVRGQGDAFFTLANELTSKVVLPFMNRVDSLLYSTVNNSQMIGSLDCLYDGTNSLPSLEVFTAWLGDLDITINDTIAVLDLIPPQLNGIDTPVLNGIDTLRGNLQDLQSQLALVTSDVTATAGLMQGLFDVVENVSSDTIGARRILTDLGALNTDFPSSTSVNAANTALTTFATGGQNDQDSGPLVAALNPVKTSFQSMKDYSALADVMLQFNGNVQTLLSGTFFSDLDDSINQTLQDLVPLKTISQDINATFIDIANSTVAYTRLDNVVALLFQAEQIATNISFQTLYDEINKIYQLGDLFPCLETIFDNIVSFNTSIFTIPGEFANISNLLDTFNASLVPLYDVADNVTATVQTFENKSQSLGVTEIANTVASMKVEIMYLTGNLTNDDVLSKLADTETRVNSVNVSILDDVRNLQDQLANNQPSSTDITAMRDLESTKDNLTLSVSNIISDLQLYEQGVCVLDTTVPCAFDADCVTVTGICNVALKRKARCVSVCTLLELRVGLYSPRAACRSVLSSSCATSSAAACLLVLRTA